jgi:hypothetical protein
LAQRLSLFRYNGREIFVWNADINVCWVGLLFGKYLNHDSYMEHDSYFLSSCTLATQIESSCFKPFSCSSKWQRQGVKNGRKFVTFLTKIWTKDPEVHKLTCYQLCHADSLKCRGCISEWMPYMCNHIQQ